MVIMKLSKIQIRDPFVLTVPEKKEYWLFGTTDADCWGRKGKHGFDCYRSRDLENWEGPFPAFRAPCGFWGKYNFWAPEVHKFRGRYYMFASFKADRCLRGTQILVAQTPQGPYKPMTPGPVTPKDWQCLDGTLHVDRKGDPWIVFCHEWVQICNGAICALPLSKDLKKAAGRPVFLFNASEAKWVLPYKDKSHTFPCYVTDGPFMFRTKKGVLLMLWSSFGKQGYAMGIARSLSGEIIGPWVQEKNPIWAKDGGHGMIFRRLDGKLMMTIHAPNKTPHERAVFVEVKDADVTLKVV